MYLLIRDSNQLPLPSIQYLRDVAPGNSRDKNKSGEWSHYSSRRSMAA